VTSLEGCYHALDHDIRHMTGFNALFQLDESAVSVTLKMRPFRAAPRDSAPSVKPGIRRELLKPSETRSFSGSYSELYLKSDRHVTRSRGCVSRPGHVKIWSRPSCRPYRRMRRSPSGLPPAVRMAPFRQVLKGLARLEATSHRDRLLRETTMLPRLLFSLMTRLQSPGLCVSRCAPDEHPPANLA